MALGFTDHLGARLVVAWVPFNDSWGVPDLDRTPKLPSEEIVAATRGR